MRAYELHAHAKQIKRSSGRSSVAAVAYRSGSRIIDERTGLIHDYTKKQGVEHSQIFKPDNAPVWAQDRATLWNAVEVKENRSNSATAHELEVAFPSEFNAMQRREAGTAIAQELVQRYGGAVDIAYHAPSLSGDQRNYHAHIMFTTRGFDEGSKDGWSRTKFRDLSKDFAKDEHGDFIENEDGQKQARGQFEILALRQFLADEMNRIAERDGLEVRTEFLSFEKRGIEQEPTQKLGPHAAQMEKENKQSQRGNKNREIQAANDNIKVLQDQANIIDLDYERQRRAIMEEIEIEREKQRGDAEILPFRSEEERTLTDAQNDTIKHVTEFEELAHDPMSDLQGWLDQDIQGSGSRAPDDSLSLGSGRGVSNDNALQSLHAAELDERDRRRRKLEAYESSYLEHVGYLQEKHRIEYHENKVIKSQETYDRNSGFLGRLLFRDRFERSYNNLEDSKAALTLARSDFHDDLNQVHEQRRHSEMRELRADLEAQSGQIEGGGDLVGREPENKAIQEAMSSPESAERLSESIQPKTSKQRDQAAHIRNKAQERKSVKAATLRNAADRQTQEQEQEQEQEKQSLAQHFAALRQEVDNPEIAENETKTYTPEELDQLAHEQYFEALRGDSAGQDIDIDVDDIGPDR